MISSTIEFITNFDYDIAERIYYDYWWVWALSALLYLPVTFGLKKFMENRPPFNLRKILAVWSGILAIYSIIGTAITVPWILRNWKADPNFICSHYPEKKSYHYNAAGFIYMLFNFSKIFELGDSIFIVLHKKELIFLHYYHHITVLLFVWYCSYYSYLWTMYGKCHNSIIHIRLGAYVATMNMFIHSIMYTYYTLTALGHKWLRKISHIITLCQIAQMV